MIVGSTERVAGSDVTVVVELDGDAPAGAAASDWGGETREDRVKKTIDRTRDVFGDGLSLARDCAARAVDSFTKMTDNERPDSFEIQLAIRFDVEAGAVVTKIGAGAQMQVTMRWENPRE